MVYFVEILNMGIVIRQSIKASLVSYIGAAIGAITIIFIYPYFLKPDQIGLIRVITEAATLFALFSLFGSNSAFVKYYPEYSQKDLGGFLSMIFAIAGFGFAMFCIIYVFFKDQIIGSFSEKSSLVTQYFSLIIPFTIVFILISIFEIFSAQRLRIVFPKIIKEVLIRILTIALVLAFSFYALSMDTFVYLYMIIYLLALVVLFVYVQKLTHVSYRFNFNFISRKEFGSLSKYMIIIFLYSISMAISTRADLFIITSKLSLADAGIFSIAFFIAAFIEIPTKSVLQIVTPLVSKALNDNDLESLDEYYKKVAINQLLVSSLIFIVLWVNIDTIYAVMPKGDIYEKGKYVIFFIGLSKIVDAATSVNALIMSYSKYYSYSVFFVIFLAGLTITNNLAFIPIWGINGSAFATFLSLLIYNFVMIYFVWRKFRIQPFTIKTIWALLLIMGCIIPCTLLPTFGNIYVLSAIKTVFAILAFLIVVLKFNISEDFSSVGKQLIKIRSISGFKNFLMHGNNQ